MTKTDLYSDGFIINYPEGDRSKQRRSIIRDVGSEDNFYVIKQDDKLPDIAYKFYGDALAWYAIADMNPEVILNPFQLPIGKRLIIPNLEEI